MTWSTPAVFTVGQVLTATAMNNISGDFNFLYNGGLTPIYDSTFSAVSFPAASIDITSIPATWAHLVVQTYLRSDVAATGGDVGRLRFNNDSGANYNYQLLRGAGAAVNASASTAQTSIQSGPYPLNNDASNRFGDATIFIPHYTNSANHKVTTMIGSAIFASTFIDNVGGEWSSTAAINRITLLPGSGNWVTGSRVTLYGMGATS